MGYRQGLVREKGKTERIAKIESLVEWFPLNKKEESKNVADDPAEPKEWVGTKYTIQPYAFTTGKKYDAKWDKKTGEIYEFNGCRYEKVHILGVKCSKVVYPDGSYSLQGTNDTGMTIEKKSDESTIYVREAFFSTELSGRTRRYSILHPDNRLEVLEAYFYNDENRIIRAVTPTETTHYRDDGVTVEETKTKKIIWKGTRDAKGHMKEFQTTDRIYKFEPKGAKTKISVYDMQMQLIDSQHLDTGKVDELFKQVITKKDHK